MACGAFVVGVSELMTAGISDVIARDLGVEVSAVGALIFWHAVAYAVAPPLLLPLVRGTRTRYVLLAAATIFTVSTIVVTFAPDLRTAILARIVQGAASGGVLAIALALAGGSVRAEQRGKALATVLTGLSLALVVGVPIGVLVADAAGWRAAFQGVAILGAGLCLLLLAKPALTDDSREAASDPTSASILIDRGQAMALVVSFIWMSAYSTMFSYAAPLLKRDFSLDGPALSVAIFSFGLACMGGGYSGGILSDATTPHRTVVVGLALNAAAITTLLFLGGGLPMAVAFMAAWGFASWMPVAPIQSIIVSGRGAAGFALGLNNSVIQAGIGAGALLGGALNGTSSSLVATSLLLILLATSVGLALPDNRSRPVPSH